MQAELKLGDDSEVAATAADSPEQVGVRARIGGDLFRVGGDELRGEQLIDREAVLTLQPADAAAEGQPGNSGVRDDSGGDD